MRGQRTVRTGELIGPMGITSQQEEELLRCLARGRLIARVRRGLYLIPSRLPVGGSWSPDEVLALNTLIEDAGGAIKLWPERVQSLRVRRSNSNASLCLQRSHLGRSDNRLHIAHVNKGRNQTPRGCRGGTDVRKHRRGLLVSNAYAD